MRWRRVGNDACLGFDGLNSVYIVANAIVLLLGRLHAWRLILLDGSWEA